MPFYISHPFQQVKVVRNLPNNHEEFYFFTKDKKTLLRNLERFGLIYLFVEVDLKDFEKYLLKNKCKEEEKKKVFNKYLKIQRAYKREQIINEIFKTKIKDLPIEFKITGEILYKIGILDLKEVI